MRIQLSFIKNGLFGWAAVPDPKRTLSLIIIDYNQNWVPIVQTHDFAVVNIDFININYDMKLDI